MVNCRKQAYSSHDQAQGTASWVVLRVGGFVADALPSRNLGKVEWGIEKVRIPLMDRFANGPKGAC
jgi:hypothetical protein